MWAGRSRSSNTQPPLEVKTPQEKSEGNNMEKRAEDYSFLFLNYKTLTRYDSSFLSALRDNFYTHHYK